MATVTLACARCGVTDEVREGQLPPGGSVALEGGRLRYHCPGCVRANIRAIEAKLPEEWWEC